MLFCSYTVIGAKRHSVQCIHLHSRKVVVNKKKKNGMAWHRQSREMMIIMFVSLNVGNGQQQE